MHQASICGTDKLYFREEIPDAVRLPLFTWGHEGGGTVVEVGSKVREFSVGDRAISFGQGTFSDYCLFILPTAACQLLRESTRTWPVSENRFPPWSTPLRS